jgi:ribonucleoside-diphosphate reductase beta chain
VIEQQQQQRQQPQLTRCRRCWTMVDLSSGVCPVCGATDDDFLPEGKGGGRFAKLSTYSAIVARLQWDADAIDLSADARAWPELPDGRRERLRLLLCGFCIAEQAVSEHLEPFAGATDDTLLAWVLFLQRRDETRHAHLFDRIATEVLGLAGNDPEQRLAAAREQAPAPLVELFEGTLPKLAGELARGEANLEQGVSLYHMLLEGVVFTAGQRALLDDLEDGALPGVREGVARVDRDERWHIGLGLRQLSTTRPSEDLMRALNARAEEVADVWGDAVGAETKQYAVTMCRRRLSAAGLLHATAA